MIANLCIMVRVFTWHSPGLPVVFCCNGGERVRENSRERPSLWQCSIGGYFLGCPRQRGGKGEAGHRKRNGFAFTSGLGAQAEGSSTSKNVAVCVGKTGDLIKSRWN